MYGLGKKRSRLGIWMDERGIKQEWLIKQSGASKGTITSACNDEYYMPSGSTLQKIIKALREVDPSIRADMFWDI